MEFERVFYKNDFASGAALLNLYMICKFRKSSSRSENVYLLSIDGGTNWGNLGHSGGYTSYDYGASVTENRELYREKYSELKLEANFLKVSPAYLTASVGGGSTGKYTTSTSIFTTPLFGNGSATNFYVVRHSSYAEETAVTYKLNVPTSKGTFTVPQLGGSLTLSARDSKWHVTDYDLGGTNLLYSTAEIFTWKKFDSKTALVVYGGPGEVHELAIVSGNQATVVEGTGVTTQSTNGTVVLNWQTSSTRRVIQIGNLFVYILDRNTAYNYWVPDFVRDDEWGA